METFTVREAAAALGSAFDDDTKLSDVCIDTRSITPGCLFLAIRGDRFDGHDFIEKAFALGAVAALSERPVRSGKPVILVEDTRAAFVALARWYRLRFALSLVGVTGSVGKTSTKEMIYAVLSQQLKTLKTEGNLNNAIGLPRTLFRLDGSYEAAVIEMGMSDFGEISLLSRTACPNIGVITNIGVSHIETLGSRENILKAKLELLDGMASDSPLILNADDDLLSTLGDSLDRDIIYFGIDNTGAEVRAVDILEQNTTTQFGILYYGRRIEAKIPAIGLHNVRNALAAFCVGLTLDIPAEVIVRGLAAYEPSGMRQHIVQKNGVTVIEDCYNASPDSMKASLDVLSSIPCEGNRVAVLGDMLELGEISDGAHYEIGRLTAMSGADVLLCCGEKAEKLRDGALDAGMKKVYYFTEKRALSHFLAQNLQSGDAVLVKASRGMRFEEILEDAFSR